MRYLLFNAFHGAAGDMITASLLSLGADQEPVRNAMQSVVTEPSIRLVTKNGIRAIQVDTHASPERRTLDEVIEKVRGADAPQAAIDLALRVFKRIADAEAMVHGGKPHFHEVGADDAIADVIGACTALHNLKPDAVSVSELALGGGTIRTGHGILPVPAPATMAILSSSCIPVRFGTPADGELCTPTGAALLAEFYTASHRGSGVWVVKGVGYGAGTRESEDVPNVLMAMLLETEGDMAGDSVDILETTVDDVSGEVIGNTIRVLMDLGARDVSAIPCMMKKGRGGYLVRVICRCEDSGMLAKAMAEQLGTLGVRCIPSVHRFIADRTEEVVTVDIAGSIRDVPVKCGWIDGRCYMLKAEFDAVRDISASSGIPAREVAVIIEERAREKFMNPPAGEQNGTGTGPNR
ncbi:MAG TPA: nickel pincer cofactor biosynthesis protein LarC [Methanoregulaceae archaeon]|nr:nickel pincer cofactor biosynthesis protein LarC [Methanoregulaceae archaeon]